MPTKFIRHAFCTIAVLGAFVVHPSYAQAVSPPLVRDYDVFVDLPTAFAFIKLPMGWKFIGKLDAEQVRHLPPGTLTSLLPADGTETRVADQLKARDGKS